MRIIIIINMINISYLYINDINYDINYVLSIYLYMMYIYNNNIIINSVYLNYKQLPNLTFMALRQQCKQRLKLAFDSIRAISGSLTYILVVDDASLKVISSTIKMMQLVNYGINSIQRLQLVRKKFNKIQAVYMIHPDNYQLLLNDYQDQKQPQYGTIHILTLTKIPILVMDQLSNKPSILKRIKTLKQLNFSFVLHSDNQFLVEKAGHNYAKDSIIGEPSQLKTAIDVTVQQLATVVTSFSQFYIVQILYSPASVSNMAEKIAIDLKQKLEKMFQLYGKYNVQNYTSSAPQTTFLILDRSYDAITPFMRDFHYLPLLYDMTDCHKHKIQGKQKKIYTMDDNQPIFQKFKYQHISRALNGITGDFQAFSRQHVGAKMEKGQDGNIGLDKMTEVMKKIPQYTQLKDKYSFHMTMGTKIMNSYQKGKYRMTGQLQQNLASQINQTGKAFKPGDLFEQVVKTVASLDNQQQKARILVIALLTLQLKPKQKTTLVQLLMSCKDYADSYKNTQKLTGHMLYKMGPKKVGKQQLILDRHQPKIQETVRKITQGGQADLKYLRVGTEVRGKAPQKTTLATLGRRKIGTTTEKIAKPKLIVFFCTSMSYSQIRALAAFQKDFHIIYGSHSFTTQHQFMSLINSLEADQL